MDFKMQNEAAANFVKQRRCRSSISVRSSEDLAKKKARTKVKGL